MGLTALNQSLISLVNTTARAAITVEDSTGATTDPWSIHLDFMDLGGGIIFSDDWTSTNVPARIQHNSIGKFYVDLGSILPNTETSTIGEFLVNWQIALLNGGTISSVLQKVKFISARTASFLPELKLMIDKSRKLVQPSNEVYLGYSEDQLIGYLQGGLSEINAYQPSVTFTLESYPLEQRQILVNAALIVGVTSQQLYAIDTDIPNYNDQGTSFAISHQPQLAAFLNSLTARLDKLIPMMKLQYLNSGSIHVQQGPNFKLTQLVQAAPSGALFRNAYFTP